MILVRKGVAEAGVPAGPAGAIRTPSGVGMTAREWTTRLFGHGQGLPTVPPTFRRYLLRERLASLRDDLPIVGEDGELDFSVDARALQLRGTLVLRNRYDDPLYRIPQHALHRKDSMEIESGGGGPAATVWRARTPSGRDHWTVTVPGRSPLRLHGAVPDHEYAVETGGRPVAEVSRRWFRQPHTYGVAVEAGEDAALLITIAVAVDLMTH